MEHIRNIELVFHLVEVALNYSHLLTSSTTNASLKLGHAV